MGGTNSGIRAGRLIQCGAVHLRGRTPGVSIRDLHACLDLQYEAGDLARRAPVVLPYRCRPKIFQGWGVGKRLQDGALTGGYGAGWQPESGRRYCEWGCASKPRDRESQTA